MFLILEFTVPLMHEIISLMKKIKYAMFKNRDELLQFNKK